MSASSISHRLSTLRANFLQNVILLEVRSPHFGTKNEPWSPVEFDFRILKNRTEKDSLSAIRPMTRKAFASRVETAGRGRHRAGCRYREAGLRGRSIQGIQRKYNCSVQGSIPPFQRKSRFHTIELEVSRQRVNFWSNNSRLRTDRISVDGRAEATEVPMCHRLPDGGAGSSRACGKNVEMLETM